MTRARNDKFIWQDAFIASKMAGNVGFVGLLMSTFDNGDGKGFYISAAKISDLTGLNERTVERVLKSLRESGWVQVVSRGGNRGGKARANRYKLTVPISPETNSGTGAASEPSEPLTDSGTGGTKSQTDSATGLVDQTTTLDQTASLNSQPSVRDTTLTVRQRKAWEKELASEGLDPHGNPIMTRPNPSRWTSRRNRDQ